MFCVPIQGCSLGHKDMGFFVLCGLSGYARASCQGSDRIRPISALQGHGIINIFTPHYE